MIKSIILIIKYQIFSKTYYNIQKWSTLKDVIKDEVFNVDDICKIDESLYSCLIDTASIWNNYFEYKYWVRTKIVVNIKNPLYYDESRTYNFDIPSKYFF